MNILQYTAGGVPYGAYGCGASKPIPATCYLHDEDRYGMFYELRQKNEVVRVRVLHFMY